MGRCGWESSDQFLLPFLLLHSHKLKHLLLFSTSSAFSFTHYFLRCRLIHPSTLYFALSVAVTPSLPSLGSSVVLRFDPQWEAPNVGVQEGHPCLCPWVRCPHSSAPDLAGGGALAPFSRLLRHLQESGVWSSGLRSFGCKISV